MFSDAGAVREELEVLEDAADVPSEQRDLRALEAHEIAPADDDATFGRLELLEDEPDHRRLARSGSADDEYELALVDREGHAVERNPPGS